MIEKRRVLAIIPARGGSKGIKNKNIFPVCGKPLIYYTINAAKQSKYIDEIIVSTDSTQIADVAVDCGARVPFLRPAELAQDCSKSIDAVLHVIGELKKKNDKFDILIFLQPTQPLRTNKDIDGALETFIQKGEKPLVSVCEVDESPILMRKINENGNLENLLKKQKTSTVRRQDMEKYYKVNGCIYINAINEITEFTSLNDNNIPYFMDKSHSVDIDEPVDLKMAEYYLEKLNRNQ